MGKFVAGFMVGALVAGGMTAALSWFALEGEYQHGRRVGEIEGRGQAVSALRDEFGLVEARSTGRRLFSLKTSDVVVVEVDGVKTVRVVP